MRTTILCIYMLLSAQLAFAGDKILNAEQASGKKQFEMYCSSCHGMDAKGEGPVASALKQKPSNLRQISKRHGGKFPVATIERIIDGRDGVEAHGPREMPVWGREFSASIGGGSLGEELVGGKLKVLVEYLKSIQE